MNENIFLTLFKTKHIKNSQKKENGQISYPTLVYEIYPSKSPNEEKVKNVYKIIVYLNKIKCVNV